MPRIMIPGPVKISFYSQDCAERVHVHVKIQDKECKIWLNPIEIATRGPFKEHELNKILRLVRNYATDIQEAWDEHCCEEKD